MTNPPSRRPMLAALERRPNRAALIALAWVLASFVLLLVGWTSLGTAPPVGALGTPAPLAAGIAALHAVLLRLIEPEAARLTAAWWPLLWLLPTLSGAALVALRLGGDRAMTIALALGIGLALVPGLRVFLPGRLDGAAPLVALALLCAGAACFASRSPILAIVAGAAGAAALALSFSILPVIAAIALGLALSSIRDHDACRGLRDFGLALAATTIVAFLVLVPEADYSIIRCDGFALNGAAAMLTAALTLALAGALAHPSTLTRALAALAALTLPLAVAMQLAPHCALAGALAIHPLLALPPQAALWPEPLLAALAWLATALLATGLARLYARRRKVKAMAEKRIPARPAPAGL